VICCDQDLELWFPDGDTLVYLTDKPAPIRNLQGLYKPPPPQPSFRIKSSVLRSTESPFLIAQLEGYFRNRPATPPRTGLSPDAEGSSLSMDYEYSGSGKSNDEEGILNRLYFPAPMGADKTAVLRHHLTTRNFFAILFNKSLVGITLGQTLLDLVERTDLYLSPPNPLAYDLVDRGIQEVEGPYGSILNPQAGHSLHFPGPKVGNAHTQKLIMDYLQRREFDDVRNWPEGAAGLLVWAERAGASGGFGYGLGGGEIGMTGIESMWREGFVHCTGMLARLEGGGEWREISPITKALIDRASLEIQVRVATADQRLSNFNYTDMWPTTSAASPPARIAFDKFQKFLVKHYQARFGSWPPQTPDGRFTRMLYVQLSRDFAALYDYLVDREVSWSGPSLITFLPPGNNRHSIQPPNNTGSSRKIIKHGSPHWRADDDDLQMTDILLGFDDRHKYPHIPHPFPLVPPTMSPPTKLKLTSNASSAAGRFFTGAARRGSIPPHLPSNSTPFINSATEKAAALSLSESTNIESLLSASTSNSLVDAFAKHEKSIQPTEVDPHDARKGRWLLIYGILQTLATVSVDAPGLRWTDKVDYFLCAKLRGTPPWKGGAGGGVDAVDFGGNASTDERSHFRSHCWTVPRSWRDVPVPPPPGTPVSSIVSPFLPPSPPLPMRTAGPPRERECERDVGRDSGDDGDDEMGGMSDAHAEAGRVDRVKKKDSRKSFVENKVRWQDAWGTGPVSKLGD